MLLGLLSIVLAWAGFVFLLATTDKTGHTTISGLSMARKQNHIIYATSFALSGILFFLFIKLWFADVLELPIIFIYLTALATLILQPMAALAPFKSETAKDIHNIAVHIEALLLPILVVIICSSAVLPASIKLVCVLTLTFMLYLLIEFRRQLLKPKFINIQIAYISSFHIIILLTGFYAAIKL